MSSKDPIILPEKYYLDYFNYLLDFVQKHYHHVLDAPEYLFIQSFNDLSEDARCLYLRFSNRKGDFFRISKLNYVEIDNIRSAKEELFHQGFININQSLDPAQFQLFTKGELLDRFEFLDAHERKSELLTALTEGDIPALFDTEEIAEVKKNEEVEFLKLLFFGNRYHQMTEFVVRDVGHVKIKELDESKFKPWFQSREEALGVMHISQLRKMVREIIETGLPLEDYLEEMPWNQWMQYPRTQNTAEKLLLKIADHFERTGIPLEALKYYELTKLPPSGERRVRILDKFNRKEEAISIAQQIVDAPTNKTELTFATDFLNRSGVRINRSMTKRLQAAPSIELKKSNKRVEDQVLDHLADEGWRGIHAENFLWRGLFGLVFWEELYNQDLGSFHHPLQRQPSDLHKPEFFEERRDLFESRILKFKTRKKFIEYIQSMHDQNNGISNRFVYWWEDLMPTLEIMIEKLPLKGIKSVLIEIAKQTKENSTGFPDLFVWSEDGYYFYEVKSPNDHLSAQQLFWLDFLKDVGIKADILRVRYI